MTCLRRKFSKSTLRRTAVNSHLPNRSPSPTPTEDYSIGIKNSAPSAKLLNNMDKSSVDDLVGTTSVEAYGGKLKCLAPCFFDDDVESVLNVEADKIVRSKMPDLNAWSAITLKNGKILVVGGRKKR